jgi:CHAT domain-containing protein
MHNVCMNCIAKFGVLVLLGLSLSLPAYSQDSDIENSFRKVSPAEEARLRAKLAEPAPLTTDKNKLRDHYTAQDAAAFRLADPAARIKVLREAVESVPTVGPFRNNLGLLLIGTAEEERGIALVREAIALGEKSDPVNAAHSEAYLASLTLLKKNKFKETEQVIRELLVKAQGFETSYKNAPQQKFNHLLTARLFTKLYSLSYDLHMKLGQFPKALEVSLPREQWAREALKRVNAHNLAKDSLSYRFTVSDLGNALAEKVSAYRRLARYSEAERALAENLRAAKELEMPASHLAGLYMSSGINQWAQQGFNKSLAYFQQADRVYTDLGREEFSSLRRNARYWQANALNGAQRFSEAKSIYDSFDNWAGSDTAKKNQVVYSFDRAVTWLGLNNPAQAAPLFLRSIAGNSQTYGASHFFTAQSRGLYGTALLRIGRAEDQQRMRAALSRAVQDYMLPSNAEFLESYGPRYTYKNWIFDAYLEAVSSDSTSALQALGAADWVRSGSVQDALNDAAVRAAASTPALADVVRREQDARNEIKGLRSYLSGEAGNSERSTLPEIASQMRERIAELEKQRDALQAEIKAKFPDYEQLVRPAPVQVATLAQQLSADEAVVVLLPTEKATYVWAVGADAASQGFARVPVGIAAINTQVKAIRDTLDFAQMGSSVKAFNAAASHELYSRLLKPLEAQLAGKKHLIVAAGGSLAQLPFGVLLTAPVNTVNAQSPWLIRQSAVTQVPSVSAWMALRRVAKGTANTTREPLLAWGDPVFSSQPPTSGSALSTQSVVRNVALKRADTSIDIEAAAKQAEIAAAAALRYGNIPPLPETRDELQAIVRILQASERDLILGSNATKASVLQANKAGQLARKQVIAFATHGLMAGDLENLTQPALAMSITPDAATNPLSALLTLEDVLTLKMNADWVILSACNTAAADGKVEEALSGLARGFFYAGAKNLLVTHWAVDSESAVLLTTATLQHYKSTPTSLKAESLRQAMMSVMQQQKFSHPAYWAAYALVGDGGR